MKIRMRTLNIILTPTSSLSAWSSQSLKSLSRPSPLLKLFSAHTSQILTYWCSTVFTRNELAHKLHNSLYVASNTNNITHSTLRFGHVFSTVEMNSKRFTQIINHTRNNITTTKYGLFIFFHFYILNFAGHSWLSATWLCCKRSSNALCRSGVGLGANYLKLFFLLNSKEACFLFERFIHYFKLKQLFIT